MILLPFFQNSYGDRLAKNVKKQDVIPGSTRSQTPKKTVSREECTWKKRKKIVCFISKSWPEATFLGAKLCSNCLTTLAANETQITSISTKSRKPSKRSCQYLLTGTFLDNFPSCNQLLTLKELEWNNWSQIISCTN